MELRRDLKLPGSYKQINRFECACPERLVSLKIQNHGSANLPQRRLDPSHFQLIVGAQRF